MKRTRITLAILTCLFPLCVWGQMTSFKFNNKFNHRLYTDAEGVFDGDTIRVSAACIGKWLTPSFKLQEGDVAYVNGTSQVSKVSCLSFKDPVTYHVVNEQSGFEHDYTIVVDFLTDNATGEYRIPIVYIQTADGKLPTSKTTYKDATIRIDGGGVFPDYAEAAIQIRGRGNSSWNNSSKKPYRLKLAESGKPFGLTKGKNWVLLANNQQKSAFCNAIAMEIAGQIGTEACNHIVPCELYINNEYRGLYNFTENPGFGNNSIDLEDESKAVLLELDSYYDETYKFKDSYFNVCTNVKEPDFSDPSSTELTFNDVKSHYNAFCQVLKNGTDAQLTQKLDVVSAAKARFVTELTRNTEVQHPKSWRLYNADITQPDSLYVFGPVWDFDWAFGYDGSGEYYKYSSKSDLFQGMGSWNAGYPYFNQLFRGFDSVKREYYRLWVQWLQKEGMEELCDFIDCYYDYVSSALDHDKSKWHDSTNYKSQKETAKQWLQTRADYLYGKADVYELDGIEQIMDVDLHPRYDIFDLNGRCVRRDVSCQNLTDLQLPAGIYIINHQKIIIR